MTLTVGSLFSGIGGIDLGLERAGMNVLWHSEIDPFACRVLKKHWPHVPNIGDITKIDWSNIPYVDVIAGGYPCQPFSLAGKRRGENDPRHLWPYFRDAISHLRPRYALLENVRGHLSMGGLSVIGDLTALGYNVEWRIISAASVGANHRRDRFVAVAYPNGADGRASEHDDRIRREDSPTSVQERRTAVHDRTDGRREIMADTLRGRRETTHRQRLPIFPRSDDRWNLGEMRSIPDWWQIEPDVGRVADGVPARMDRLRGLGNAVVPQVAEVVGRLIVSHSID